MVQSGATITVCDVCNVVLARDGVLVENRPSTLCSHLRGSTWVAPPEPPVDADGEHTPRGRSGGTE